MANSKLFIVAKYEHGGTTHPVTITIKDDKKEAVALFEEMVKDSDSLEDDKATQHKIVVAQIELGETIYWQESFEGANLIKEYEFTPDWCKPGWPHS